MLAILAATLISATAGPGAYFVSSPENEAYTLMRWSPGAAPAALFEMRFPQGTELLAAAVDAPRKVAYLATQRGDHGVAIQKLCLAERSLTTLRTTSLWDVAGMDVSPDGSEIALGAIDASGLRLVALSADGSRAEAISDADFGSFPSYSPDGRRIAMQQESLGEDGGAAIWVMDRSTRGMQRLSPEGGRCSFPAWAPDGSWIAYLWSDDGFGRFPEIHAVGHDGSEPSVLAKDLPEGDLSRLVFSDDGKSLWALAAFRGLARLNLETGEVTLVAEEENALPDLLLSWVPAEN